MDGRNRSTGGLSKLCKDNPFLLYETFIIKNRIIKSRDITSSVQLAKLRTEQLENVDFDLLDDYSGDINLFEGYDYDIRTIITSVNDDLKQITVRVYPAGKLDIAVELLTENITLRTSFVKQ